jgi:putative ABC transport system substrate-binding protein
MQRLLYRKKFLIKPSQRGLGGKVSHYRNLGGKKFRLNGCSAAEQGQSVSKEITMRFSTVGLVATLALVLLLVPLASDAQQATKVPQVGRLLSVGSPTAGPDPSFEAFRQGLRELGYVEGQNVVIADRYAEGSQERLRDLAAELARLPVDVIVAEGAAAIRAAQHATRTIPIVMAATADPVGQGFVASLAHPGGNITGLSSLSAELPGKRLELLKETVPQSTHIAVLINATHPYYTSVMSNLTGAARALGLHLHVVEVRSMDELDTAFAAMTQAGADAVLVIEEALLLNSERGGVVADLATQSRLPVMYSWREWVVAGCLMSYGPSRPDVLRRAATYVDKLLKGAQPADLPVEQSTKFELVINLKTAKALGITMPPSLLLLADEVIQ